MTSEIGWDLEEFDGTQARADLARLLREAAGATARDLVAATIDGCEAIWTCGRIRLVEAAGWSVRAWLALPEFSRARARVLLRGARLLGIKTDWKGWSRGPDRA